MKKTKETWKPVTCTDIVMYEVSSKGNVRNLKTGRILKPFYNTKGYARVDLTRASSDKTKKALKLVHRLVAQAFIPNPNKLPEVNHKDEIKANNNLDNLEWVSHRDNSNYGKRNERISKSMSKPIVQIDLSTGLIIKTYPSTTIATRVTGINYDTISRAARGIIKSAGRFGWRYTN